MSVECGGGERTLEDDLQPKCKESRFFHPQPPYVLLSVGSYRGGLDKRYKSTWVSISPRRSIRRVRRGGGQGQERHTTLKPRDTMKNVLPNWMFLPLWLVFFFSSVGFSGDNRDIHPRLNKWRRSPTTQPCLPAKSKIEDSIMNWSHVWKQADF